MVEMRGVEPLSNLPYAALSTCLEIVWIFRISAQSQAFNWWFRFVTTALSDVGRCCLFLWCRLLREQKTLGRHAAKLSSELWFLFAFIFCFRFYVDEPTTCLWRNHQTVECRNIPIDYIICQKSKKATFYARIFWPSETENLLPLNYVRIERIERGWAFTFRKSSENIFVF